MELFRTSAFNHAYDMQAYLNLRATSIITGYAHTDFYFLCIESKGHHGLKIYYADEEMLRSGQERYEKAMEKYLKCVKSNVWPGYNSFPEPIGIPKWAKTLDMEKPVW